MKIKAQLADGSWVEYDGIPESVTADQFIEQVRQDYQQEPVDIEHKKSMTELIKMTGKALLRGAGNTAGVLLDRPGYEDPMLAMAGVDATMPEGGIGKKIEEFLPKPAMESAGEKLLRMTAEGAGSGLAVPIGGPTGAAISGGAGGAGQYLGGEVAGVPGELLGGLAGGLAGARATTGPMFRPPPLVRATREAVASMPPAALAAAAQRQGQMAQTLGAPIMLPQAIEDHTPFMALMKELSASPETGAQVHSVLNRQTGAARDLAKRTIEEVSPTVPGQREANLARDAAARETAGRPGAVRTGAASGFYKKGKLDTFGTAVRYDVPADLQDSLEDLRVLAKSNAGRAFSGMSKRIIEDSIIIDPATNKPFARLSGEPMEMENFRKELSKMIEQSKKDTATGADITKRLGLQHLERQLRRVIDDASPDIKKGRAVSASGARVEEAIREKAIGKMAPKGEDELHAAGNFDKLGIVFKRAEDFSPKDVRDVAAHMNRSDPKAFPNLLRQHMESNMAKVEKLSQGRASTDMPAQMSEAVYGIAGSRERENILTAIEEIAKQRKQDPVAARRGAENIIAALEAAGRDRGALGVMNPIEIRRAREHILSKVLKGAFYKAGEAMSAAAMRDEHRAVLEAITAPDGIKKLLEVSQFSLAANRLKALGRTATPMTQIDTEE